jgi:hypothetical protein
MKTFLIALATAAMLAGGTAVHSFSTTPDEPRGAVPLNPAIDMQGFLDISQEAARHRETRRVSEEEFIRMAGEPGTIILDARSREMYDLLHVKGAINLPFPDIAIASLAERIPDKGTRILIYCNNNFENEEKAFARKMAPASLNLSTYVSLYTYGYRNVYELGPKKDVKDSRLTLVSSAAKEGKAAE